MKQTTIRVSPAVIWISSVFLGILSSAPHIAEQNFSPAEAIVNGAITAVFALFMWYFNLFILYSRPDKPTKQGHSSQRLIGSLTFGVIVLLGLAWIQQLILSYINFGPVVLMVELKGILINLVFYMFLHLLQQNYENQRVRLELEHIRNDALGSQYELLKQQLNPHFLFNSLSTLKAMVDGGDEQAADFILKLANFYRYTLESHKFDLIPVGEEMEILRAYLFLQKARFEAGFTFTSTLDDKTQTTLIPPFTLQLLVENCFKHNVVALDTPLHIRLYREKDNIVVENQVQPEMAGNSSLGVGLKNINLRYDHLLGRQIEIIGTDRVFQIKLPLIYEHPHR